MPDLDPATRARLDAYAHPTRPLHRPNAIIEARDVRAALAAHAAAVAIVRQQDKRDSDRLKEIVRLESDLRLAHDQRDAAVAERDDAEQAIREHWRPLVAALEAERDAMRAGLVAAGQSYARERDERVAVVQHALDEERTRRDAAVAERDAAVQVCAAVERWATRHDPGALAALLAALATWKEAPDVR